MPEFSLDMDFDDAVLVPETDLYEDISSFTEPHINSFAEPENFTGSDDTGLEEETSEEETPAVFSEFKAAIFADDEGDESPIDFAYHTDFDALFEETDE